MGSEKHPSDALVQREIEALILQAVGKKLGIKLNQKVTLSIDGAHPVVDGATEDESVLVEAFAHYGPLKGAQFKKVASDGLKLIALGETRPAAKLILAFADEQAKGSIVGWLAAVFKRRGVELIAVKLSAKDRARVIAAQKKQGMKNIFEPEIQ